MGRKIKDGAARIKGCLFDSAAPFGLERDEYDDNIIVIISTIIMVFETHREPCFSVQM